VGGIMIGMEFIDDDYCNISDCYFERGIANCNGISAKDIFIPYDTNNKLTIINSYSISLQTKVYGNRSDPKNKIDLLPPTNPLTITPNNPIVISKHGVDRHSCFNTTGQFCRSMSFACLAQLSNGENYNISVGSGYFYEYHIKAANTERQLNIEGSGIEETTIIALYH
jgi:hypothetical protein